MTKICLLALFAAITLITSASGQTGDLKNDLDKKFKKFSVVRLKEGENLRRDDAARALSVTAENKTYQMTLEPRDLRAPRYRAENTGPEGTTRIERAPVTTYKGKIDGESFSEVRLSIAGDEIEGYFRGASGRFFIEPAKRFSKAAAEGESVVYRAEDLLETHSFNCESDLAGRFESGQEFVAQRLMGSAVGLQVLELATDADYDYVTSYGAGAAGANQKVLSVLNMVEGVYETELALTISVVFQHTWTTADPFGGANSNAVLQNFQNHWNTNYPLAQYPRDAAHLFTAKSNVLSQGYAYLGTICRNPAFAYGLSGRMNPEWNWETGNFLVTSHELGHNLGAHHAETAQSCGDTLMNAQLGWSTALSFCSFSRQEVGTFVSTNGSCLAQQSVAGVRYDFDGDGKADPSVFRPSSGVWYIARSAGGFGIFQFGVAGDMPVAADYDGDGKTDAAVFRNGVWYRLKSSNNTFDAAPFGLATDIPAPGDFDGDGKTDIAVFRPSNGSWHRLNSRDNSYTPAQFGASGDIPVAADYDGDGKADVNVFRPSNGTWYRLNSSNGSFFGSQFGASGDRPIAGDFDGDGKADLAIWRPSNGVWYIVRSSSSTYQITSFGLTTDIPTAADYDGDGKTDIGVFRPSDGNWHRLNSASGGYLGFQFGISTDIPVSRSVY